VPPHSPHISRSLELCDSTLPITETGEIKGREVPLWAMRFGETLKSGV
jgi:hypothetical protein